MAINIIYPGFFVSISNLSDIQLCDTTIDLNIIWDKLIHFLIVDKNLRNVAIFTTHNIIAIFIIRNRSTSFHIVETVNWDRFPIIINKANQWTSWFPDILIWISNYRDILICQLIYTLIMVGNTSRSNLNFATSIEWVSASLF